MRRMRSVSLLILVFAVLIFACTAQEALYTCSDGETFPISFECDGVSDCDDGGDEENCTGVTPLTFFGTVPCDRANAVRCGNGTGCIRLSEMCDGEWDCPDSSDESFSGPGFKCIIKSAVGVPCVLPQINLKDMTPHCTDGTDLCFDASGALTGNCFQCLDKRHVISAYQVCDGTLDCGDFSDECLCENQQIPEVCHLYSGTSPFCVDGFDAAIDIGYEIGDFGLTTLSSRTEPWINVTVPCGDGQCISSEQLCDDIFNCHNGWDEVNCYSSSTETYLHTLNSQLPANLTSAVAGFFNHSASGVPPKETILCQNDFGGETIVAVKCDGRPSCVNFTDECIPECGELPPFCSVDLFCLFTPYVCDGVWQSDLYCEGRIPQEELGCPNRFYCKNGPAISIAMNQRCDGVINCDDESDEDAAQNCSDGRFFCETRDENDTSPLNRLFVPANFKLNGRQECSDGSDECPMGFNQNQYSSREEMIKSVFLRVILWFIAPIALVGNILVLVKTFRQMYKKRKMKNPIAKSHTFMIVNLSIADGMMGIYLTILCIASSVHSGMYCLADKPWRTSSACNIMGSLVLFSSEASVLILLIMGIFRLYTIYQPFEAKFSSKSGKMVKLAVTMSWLTSLVLAILPWVVDSFDSYVWFPSPFFLSDVVNKTAFATFTSRLSTMQRYLADNPQFSSNITFTMSSDSVSYNPRGTLGFYSQNGVCLPNFFTRIGDPGWQLTTLLVTFNFVAFISMVIVYSLIWYLSTSRKAVEIRRNVPKGAKLNYQKCKLQSRVTRLLFTDFLCWIPLCCMAYAFLAGAQFDDVAYAVAGIILLPINSALNPILYSGLFDTLFAKCLRVCKKHRVGSKLMAKFDLGEKSEDGPVESQRSVAENTVTTSVAGTPQLNQRKQDPEIQTVNETNGVTSIL